MNLSQIASLISALPPGKCITLDPHTLGNCGWNWILYEHPAEHVMENVVGSAYAVRYWTDFMTMNTTFERLKKPLPAGDVRTYVSPDRRYLYRQRPDGLFELHNEPETEAARALRKMKERSRLSPFSFFP